MKTTSLSARLLLAGACMFVFSAHRPAANKTNTFNNEDYYAVHQYAEQQICAVVRAKLKHIPKGKPEDYFSRCPSGFQTQLVTNRKDVKTNCYVNGRIVFYRGCGANTICDFKVCVDDGFAVVKSKGMTEYMSVEKWIELKNQEGKTLVKS